MIRQTIHFTGSVQGVGFRFSTRSIARAHKVAGYVQNLPDGRVRLVAEGEPADVYAFVRDVARNMATHIQEQDVTTTSATGEFGVPAPGALSIHH
ncbi:MAG: acylphosphatase [Phycisphaeraceae bacterium]